jgi:hypothetical protein
MIWNFEGNRGLLSWGKAGKPESGAVLVDRRDRSVAGVVFQQADNSSLPIATPFVFAVTDTFQNNGEASLEALCVSMALAAGMEPPAHGAPEASRQPESAMSMLAQFEAWKQGQGIASEPVPAPDRPSLRTSVYAAGTSLGFLRPTGVNVARGQKAPRLGVPLDGRRGLSALRGLVSSPFVSVEFVREAAKRITAMDIGAAEAALSSVAAPTTRALSWYADKNHPSHQDRLQAAATVPVLAGVMADSAPIANAIDRRLSIQPLLISRTGLTKGGLKRLGKIRAQLPAGVMFEEQARGRDALDVDRVRRLTLKGRIDESRASQILAELPPDWAPQTDEAWLAFGEIASGAAIPLFEVANIPIAKTMGASKGDWVSFKATLAKAADMPLEQFGRREIGLTTSDAIEVIDEMARMAVMPLVLQSIASTNQPLGAPLESDLAKAREVAFELIAGRAKSPATTLFEIARRYMSRIPSLDNLIGLDRQRPELDPAERWAGYGDSSWPPVMEDFVARNGLVLRNLTRRELLTEESRRLGHCVGRMYQEKALQGGCHIISVQTEDGLTSLSTIELAPPGIDGTVREVQHRARNNQVPDPQAMEAANQLLHALRTRAHPMNLREVADWREYQLGQPGARREVAQRATWEGALGISFTNQGQVDGLWAEWKDIIGGDVAKLDSSQGLYRYAEVRALVDTISPSAAKTLRDRAQQAAIQQRAGAEPQLAIEP